MNDFYMEHQVELLQIVSSLVGSYTSKDRSSVPYEIAQQLMGAVIYTIDECFKGDQTYTVTSGNEQNTTLHVLYRRGVDLVKNKTEKVRNRYNELIPAFEDYGCRNYADTIRRGMPSFFAHYDMFFNPQDTILSLDYPMLYARNNETGIDLIDKYIDQIVWENHFLGCFDKNILLDFFRFLLPEYRALYLDNLCEPVLLQIIACRMADQPIWNLRLDFEDELVIRHFISGETKMSLSHKISILLNDILPVDDRNEEIIENMAVRILNSGGNSIFRYS